MNYKIFNDDCLEILKTIEDNSVDSIITDPPYGLSNHKTEDVIKCLSAWISGEPYRPNKKGFMGKEWDAWVPGPEIWKEALRVLKPGGHILAFAGTRSMDLMSMSIRLAGFELRDSIGYAHDKGEAPLVAWVYGEGFPKSHNISKAIDKAAGVEREVIGSKLGLPGYSTAPNKGSNVYGGGFGANGDAESECQITAPTTKEAKKWEGFGSAIKPAFEPIILARKPLVGTIVENVLKHGTGGLNIDGCRVRTGDSLGGGGGLRGSGGWDRPFRHNPVAIELIKKTSAEKIAKAETLGRWPANLIHDGSEEVLKLFPEAKSGTSNGNAKVGQVGTNLPFERGTLISREDSGSAARFFYCAKTSKKDRNSGLTDQTNDHPTVKPTELMKYLCRLITPPGGTVLDPFMGSGSTGKAALLENFNFIGIELDSHYCEIAEQRMNSVKPTVTLDDIFQ